jgi:hypothetical protein
VNEAAWRENYRRDHNEFLWRSLIRGALNSPKSKLWCGYWQRGQGWTRCESCSISTQRGIRFRSLTQEFLDTKTAMGRGVLALVAAIAEDEVERLRERTRAGMQAAKRRGQHVGRPRKLTPHKVAHARQLIAEGKETQAGAAALLGVGVATLRRALNGADDLAGSPRHGQSVRPLCGPEIGPSSLSGAAYIL